MMAPITALERERVRCDQRAEARLKQAVKIAMTAGYAAFGAAFFEHVINDRALELASFGWAAFGIVALSLSVWYAPTRTTRMSAIDVLMSIVAVATTGLFIWMEALRRERIKLTAEIDALRDARQNPPAPAE